MSQRKDIELPFDEAIDEVDLTPEQVCRIDTRRRDWKLRKRRSRAKQRWKERTASEAAIEEAAKRARRTEEEHELTDEWIGAINILFAAIQCGGELAAKAFDLACGDDFQDPTLGLVFETARSLHERGAQVNRAAVVATLRRRGILLLDGGAMLDAAFQSPDVPQAMRPGDVERNSAILKQA